MGSHSCISYRLPPVPSLYIVSLTLFPINYIVSSANSTNNENRIVCHHINLCISYRLPSINISVYGVACHQFPTLCIVTPDIISAYGLAIHHFQSPISYGLPSFLITVYRIACTSVPINISYRLSWSSNYYLSYRMQFVPFCYIVSPAIRYYLCVSYNLPSVPTSLNRFASFQYTSLYLVPSDTVTIS